MGEKYKIPKKYQKDTKNVLVAAAGVGPLGALTSVGDIAAIAAICGGFLYSFAKKEGVEIDKDSAVKVCKSALLGMGGYYAGCKLATRIFNFIPGAGTLMGMGVSSVANILFTYRYVLTLCNIFGNRGPNFDIANLADNLISMFNGNGLRSDAMDIIHILANW